MRVMIDVVHPAHVHFYRNLWSELVARGDEVLVVSRDKDVTLALLDHFGIEHVPVGRAGRRSIVGHGLELAHRDLALIRLGRRFRPDIVLTRNPAGVRAARILRVPGVFDTEPGTAARLHWRAKVDIQHLGVDRVMQEIRLCEPEVGIVVDDLHKVFNQILVDMLCSDLVIQAMNRHAWPREIPSWLEV